MLGLALCASAGVLWFQAAAMAEVSQAQAGEAPRSMLNSTHLELAWKIGMDALMLATAAIALAKPGRREQALILVGLATLAGFLYTRSMVSHASADGDFSALMVVDWAHLILICLWVGEVIVSGLVVFSSLPGALPEN